MAATHACHSSERDAVPCRVVMQVGADRHRQGLIVCCGTCVDLTTTKNQPPVALKVASAQSLLQHAPAGCVTASNAPRSRDEQQG